MKANICNGAWVMCWVNSENTKVPVVPYMSDIPNNNNPDEKAEEIISFIAASDEAFLRRSKLAIAANGMVDSSSPR